MCHGIKEWSGKHQTNFKKTVLFTRFCDVLQIMIVGYALLILRTDFRGNFYQISAILINNQYLIVLVIPYSMANYLGDNNKRQVHDLLNQKDNCQIDEIMIVHKRHFIPDTFTQANSEGYESCIWCIGNSQE